MNQIVIALLALAFQLVSSQTACLDAQTALSSDATCSSAIDASTLCNGTCRTLYDNIISSCDDTTAAGYISAIDLLCSPCAMAESALVSNTACRSVEGTNAMCMGTCRTLYDNIIRSCDNATAAVYITVIDVHCSPCGMAQSALVSNLACLSATDSNTVCMGTCRTLYNNVISSCDNITAAGSVATIDNLCSPCGMAQSALISNTICASTTDASTVCTGTCRDLYNDIIDNCDFTIAVESSATINAICEGSTNIQDRCSMAGGAVNEACFALLELGDNATCTGTCGSQLATAAAACTTSSDRVIQTTIRAYNNLCGTEAQCTAATDALDAISSCDAALQRNDTGILCSATCRILYEGVVYSCPITFTGITRDALNQVCEESGSEALQASGLITLLLVALCALNF